MDKFVRPLTNGDTKLGAEIMWLLFFFDGRRSYKKKNKSSNYRFTDKFDL